MASSSIRPLSLIAATLSLCLLPASSFAGKDHCRTLMLAGSAGDTSTDSVVFQIVDQDGGVIIDQSCQVTVQQGESADSLGERLPLQWYLDDDSLDSPPCPSDTEAVTLATKPNGKIKFPKKACSNSSGPSGPSCKIKFTYKVKNSTGEVKKGPQLDICCYEGPDCKGAKWGSTTANPINLQIRNNSVSLSFLPTAASLPATVGATSDLVVDPIGLEQLPVPDVQECRQAIASEVARVTERIHSVLGTCHLDASIADQSVCNTLSPSSDPTGSVTAAVTALRQDIRDACATLGSPAKFSYVECPAPCGSTITEPQCVGGPNDGQACRTDAECDSADKRCSVGTLGPACSVDADCTVSGVCLDADFCAGPVCTVNADCDTLPDNGRCARKGDGVCKNRCTAPVATAGSPCGVDSNCDSAPGAGDGRCADWAEVADCAACLAQAGIETEMFALFGPSGSTISALPGTTALSPGARECKSWLVQTMRQLLKTELKEIRSCQKLVDAGKIALPAGATKCKNADRKGKRAKAAAIIKNLRSGGKTLWRWCDRRTRQLRN